MLNNQTVPSPFYPEKSLFQLYKQCFIILALNTLSALQHQRFFCLISFIPTWKHRWQNCLQCCQCGTDQAWQHDCQSFVTSSPLISSMFFVWFFFAKLFPSIWHLALKDLLFHYMYGWYLVKQGVLCYSRDRNNSKRQVTWNNKKWADAGKLPQ